MENKNGPPHTLWPDNSHNRLHQSQWLQSTLSDLEKKAKKMISLIEDDGDTFAKRAEMFYKKKPLLVESMEDLQGSYRSLAENHYQLMIRLDNLRAFSKSKSKSGSPISENPNQIPQGSDHDLAYEGWVSLASQTENSKEVQIDDDFEKGWSVLEFECDETCLNEKREAINNLHAHVSKY